MTTAAQIGSWFDRGVEQGAIFMLIVVDTFDWEDFPIYVPHGRDINEEVAEHHHRNMEKVMEVYDLTADKDEQLSRTRTGLEYIPR